jgi:hypothetical protein
MIQLAVSSARVWQFVNLSVLLVFLVKAYFCQELGQPYPGFLQAKIGGPRQAFLREALSAGNMWLTICFIPRRSDPPKRELRGGGTSCGCRKRDLFGLII